jgi:hypothetical protein
MRTVVRRVVAVVVVLHGLIHLLGAAKGLGWADVTQLKEPISTAMGVAWLAAAVLVVLAGVLLIIRARWWWVVGAVAVVASQTVIFTLWSDAKAGTVANIILLAAAVYGFASQGPASYRAQYRRRVDVAIGCSGKVEQPAQHAQPPKQTAMDERKRPGRTSNFF